MTALWCNNVEFNFTGNVMDYIRFKLKVMDIFAPKHNVILANGLSLTECEFQESESANDPRTCVQSYIKVDCTLASSSMETPLQSLQWISTFWITLIYRVKTALQTTNSQKYN